MPNPSASFHIVIPARYGSSRLPGKPLAPLGDAPMVIQAWRRGCAAGAESVVIATDDARIEAVARDFGAEVVLTDPSHPSGTDRIEEVSRVRGWEDDAIVVNLQGDEPCVPAAVLRQVAANLERSGAAMATLCEAITRPEAFRDPNIVKVVMDESGMALYFSRAPIPWPRDLAAGEGEAALPTPCWRHLGLYAYRVGLLRRFVAWAPATLERLEALEQLRVLAYGERIHVAEACEAVPGGVDTPEDLARLQKGWGGENA